VNDLNAFFDHLEKTLQDLQDKLVAPSSMHRFLIRFLYMLRIRR